MKLISKIHDYYDTAIGYGIDPNIVYVRKMEELDSIDMIKGINFSYPFYRLDFDNIEIANIYYIFFCGNLYVCIKLNIEIRKYASYKTVNKFCYNVDQVKEVFKKYKVDFPMGSTYSRYYRKRGSGKRKRENIFKNIFDTKVKNIMDLHFEFDTPIFIVKQYTEGLNNKNNIVLNPILKDMEFYKMVDAFTAFQEISMFISGVMGGKVPKMIEISNEDRIAKHGFDEYSFRKEKKT